MPAKFSCHQHLHKAFLLSGLEWALLQGPSFSYSSPNWRLFTYFPFTQHKFFRTGKWSWISSWSWSWFLHTNHFFWKASIHLKIAPFVFSLSSLIIINHQHPHHFLSFAKECGFYFHGLLLSSPFASFHVNKDFYFCMDESAAALDPQFLDLIISKDFSILPQTSISRVKLLKWWLQISHSLTTTSYQRLHWNYLLTLVESLTFGLHLVSLPSAINMVLRT